MQRTLPQRVRQLLPILLVFATAHSAVAQLTAERFRENVETAAARAALASYELVTLDADRLAATLSRGRAFTIALPSGRSLDVDMAETRLTGADYTVRTEGARGRSVRRGSAVRTFRGDRVAGASASLTVSRDFIQGQLPQNDGAWYIEPALRLVPGSPPGTYLVYRVADVKPGGEHSCGYERAREKQREVQPAIARRTEAQQADGRCLRVDLAIASDFDVFSTYGSVGATEAFVVGVVNSMEADFQGVFPEDVSFTIVDQYVSTSDSTSLERALSDATDSGVLIDSFSVWGRRSGSFRAAFDLSQLWVERDIVDPDGLDIYGWARVAGTCTEGGRVVLLQNFSTSAAELRTLVSHETGHTLGMTHDPAFSSDIMSRVFTVASTWSAQSKREFAEHTGGSACVAGPYALVGSPSSTFLPLPELVCVGQEVNLRSEPGRDPTGILWSLPGGSPEAATTPNGRVSYAEQGEKSITLSTTNGACGGPVTVSNTRQLTVRPESAPTTACTPAFKNGATLSPTEIGIESVTIAGKYLKTEFPRGVGSSYSDFSCSAVIDVDTLRIPFSVFTAGTATRVIKVYLDANNDGGLSEEEALFSRIIRGSLPRFNLRSGTLAIPPTVVRDQILRLRVVYAQADTEAEVKACSNALFQEVEDYGIRVAAEVPFPVELLTFRATELADHVQLDWTVANEVDVARYRVEHSTNNSPWTGVGYATATRSTSYSYVHRTPGYSTHYYRLVSVDTDGSEVTSKQIAISTRADEREMLVEANPLPGGLARLRLAGWNADSELSLEVRDMQGRLVASAKTRADGAGNARLESDLSAAGAGIYVVTVWSAEARSQVLVRR